MSTPNPLIPQGTLQQSGNSNVRIAVATVLAIHVVFFGGLLLQGCKRDAQTSGGGLAETNANTAANESALSYPALETNSLYYPSSNALPPDHASVAATPSQPTNFQSDSLAPATSTGTFNSGVAQEAWTQSTLTATPAAPTGPSREYTVVRGDTYSKIAKTEGTTVAALRNANPNIEPTRIRPGMKLVIPPPSSGNGRGVEKANGNGGSGQTYTVKPGDNLTKIAKAHGVTISQLRAANGLQTSMVKVGQKLKIPASTNTNKAAAAPATNPGPTF